MLLQDLFRSADPVVTIEPEGTLRSAVVKMRDAKVGAVVVTKGRKVVGILTDRDVALAAILDTATPETPVNTLMTTPVKTIWEDQGVFNATQYLQGHKFRRLPVVDKDDNLVGMITADDLFALLARELYNVSQALEPAIQHHV